MGIIETWCNGSTRDFGSLSPSSNLGASTKKCLIMKVIFLDIDGVLNHNAWYNSEAYYNNEYKDPDLDPNIIRMLNEVTNKHNIKLVISSSWKVDSYCIERLQKADLENVIDYTPNLIFKIPMDIYYRGMEINEYLEKHPEVDKYLILDDISDFDSEQLQFFYKIDYRVGIRDVDVLFIEQFFK